MVFSYLFQKAKEFGKNFLPMGKHLVDGAVGLGKWASNKVRDVKNFVDDSVKLGKDFINGDVGQKIWNLLPNTLQKGLNQGADIVQNVRYGLGQTNKFIRDGTNFLDKHGNRFINRIQPQPDYIEKEPPNEGQREPMF